MPVGYLECNHRRQLIRQGLFYFQIKEVEADMTYLNRVIESPVRRSPSRCRAWPPTAPAATPTRWTTSPGCAGSWSWVPRAAATTPRKGS